MRFVAPRTGAPEVTVAEDQEEYLPVTVGVYVLDNGMRGLLARVTFTDDERALIARGADVYIHQLGVPGTPMTPLSVDVGVQPWMVPT